MQNTIKRFPSSLAQVIGNLMLNQSHAKNTGNFVNNLKELRYTVSPMLIEVL